MKTKMTAKQSIAGLVVFAGCILCGAISSTLVDEHFAQRASGQPGVLCSILTGQRMAWEFTNVPAGLAACKRSSSVGQKPE